MKLLTEHDYVDDNNTNIPLVTNIEYATGQGDMFTQPPPPTIAGDVESLNDELGVKIHENDSNDHVNHKFSIEDSDKDPINKETDLVKEYDEIKEEVETN